MKNKLLFCALPLCIGIMSVHGQKASRLVAQSLYTFDGSSFRITDTTHYTYRSALRGGDLSSRYLAFDESMSLLYDNSSSALINYQKSYQNFDINNHRTVTVSAIWNKGIGAWEDAKTVYYYPDINDSLSSQVEQVWDKPTASWQNLTRQTFTYNTARQRTSYVLDNWNPSVAWEGKEKYLYEYDASGALSKTSYFSWDKVAAAWANEFIDSFAYSGSGKLMVYTSIVWNKALGKWVNNRQSTYTYDGSGYLINQLESGWDGSSSTWYPVQQYVLTNDSKGNLLEYLTQNWDAGTSAWLNIRKRVYTYDAASHLLSNTQLTWNGSGFDNGDQMLYTYDASGNELTESSALWDMGLAKWNNNEQVKSDYNSYNQLTGVHYLKWSTAATTWSDYKEGQYKHYFYEEYSPTALTHNENGNELLALYPVPARQQVTIALVNPGHAQLHFRVSDYSGRILQQWDVAHPAPLYEQQLNVAGWQAGLYVLDCMSDDGTQQHRTFSVLP